MTPLELTQQLKAQAYSLGFALAGACPARPAAGISQLEQWLAAGYAGSMNYLADRLEAYRHPDAVLPGVQSLLMLSLPYEGTSRQAVAAGQGKVARYAWGERDYHDVIHEKLKRLKQVAAELAPEGAFRGVVDTAPLLEREFAQLAGLGWTGKNTLLIHPDRGSYFFLAALLTDQLLDYDRPFTSDHCGTCRACLDACPTDAFPQPYVLDASRCISYLTIEHRGPIPESLRTQWDDWVFGCDVCQEVCPWNRKARSVVEPTLRHQPEQDPLDLLPLFSLDDEAFRQRFRKTPFWRSRRSGLLRNAAILLAQQQHLPAIPTLLSACDDMDPSVRAAVVWALQQLRPLAVSQSAAIAAAFADLQRRETHPMVLAELAAAS